MAPYIGVQIIAGAIGAFAAHLMFDLEILQFSTKARVALYITAAYWFTSSTSFADPAITIVRSFSNSFAGIAPGDVPAFVLAQLGGAALAVIIASWLFVSGDEENSET